MTRSHQTAVAVYRAPQPPLRPRPLFVYGRLADPEFASQLLGRQIPLSHVELLGFRSVELDGKGFPLLVPAPEARLAGTVLQGLRSNDFQPLDAYAGVGEGLYARHEAVCALPTGEQLDVYVYLASERTLRRYR